MFSKLSGLCLSLVSWSQAQPSPELAPLFPLCFLGSPLFSTHQAKRQFFAGLLSAKQPGSKLWQVIVPVTMEQLENFACNCLQLRGQQGTVLAISEAFAGLVLWLAPVLVWWCGLGRWRAAFALVVVFQCWFPFFFLGGVLFQ